MPQHLKISALLLVPTPEHLDVYLANQSGTSRTGNEKEVSCNPLGFTKMRDEPKPRPVFLYFPNLQCFCLHLLGRILSALPSFRAFLFEALGSHMSRTIKWSSSRDS